MEDPVVVGFLIFAVVCVIIVAVLCITVRKDVKKQGRQTKGDTGTDDSASRTRELEERVVRVSLERAELLGIKKANEAQIERLTAELKQKEQTIIELSCQLREAQKYAEWVGNLGLETNKECERLRAENKTLKERIAEYEGSENN